MIKYCIFDMDGLMLDTEMMAQRSFYECVGPRLGIEFQQGELLPFIGKNRAALIEWWAENIRDKYGLTQGWNEVSAWSYEWQVKQFLTEGVPVKEGLVELLEWIKGRDIPCAVATSTDYDRTIQKLDLADLTKYFEKIICGNMVSKSKPDPEIFLLAMNELGFDKPEEGVVFEDSLLGTRAGVAGGFNVIAVPDLVPLRGEHMGKCMAIISRLDLAIGVLDGKL